MWPLLTGLTSSMHLCIFWPWSFHILFVGYFWSHWGGTYPHGMHFSGRLRVFIWWIKRSLVNCGEESVALFPPLSPPPLPPPSCLSSILSQGDSCFLPHTGGEDEFKLWYLAACQSNSKLHTCRLLASADGKMTNVVFLAFWSWQAHHQLGSFLCLSVHKGLGFSLEAPRELKHFYYCF